MARAAERVRFQEAQVYYEEGLDRGDEHEKKKLEELNAELEPPLTGLMKEVLVVYGRFANMERITKAHASMDISMTSYTFSNNDGGEYLMSLYTGKCINSYIWEEIPIGDGVIQRIEKSVEIEKMPK